MKLNLSFYNVLLLLSPQFIKNIQHRMVVFLQTKK